MILENSSRQNQAMQSVLTRGLGKGNPLIARPLAADTLLA